MKWDLEKNYLLCFLGHFLNKENSAEVSMKPR